MYLTTEEKTRYWMILFCNCREYVGSAELGNQAYQHLGVILGASRDPKTSMLATNALSTYAKTDAKSHSMADLFDAIINTKVVRAAWKVKNKGYYFEFWSAYNGVKFEDSEPARQILIDFLNEIDVNSKE